MITRGTDREILELRVTAEDIRLGQSKIQRSDLVGRARTCPLARALIRQFGGRWWVSGSFVWDDDINTAKLYRLPEDAQDFIAAADRGVLKVDSPVERTFILTRRE